MLARTFAGKGRHPSIHLPHEPGVHHLKRGKAASCPLECPFCKSLSTPSATSNVDVEESDVIRRTTSHQCCLCVLERPTCSALAADDVDHQVTRYGSETNSMNRACPLSVSACANLLNSLRLLAMPMVMHLSSGMLEGMAAKQEDLRQLPMVMHLSSGMLEAMGAKQEDEKWEHEETVESTSLSLQPRRLDYLIPYKSVVFVDSWTMHKSDVQTPWPTPLLSYARHQQNVDSPFRTVSGH